MSTKITTNGIEDGAVTNDKLATGTINTVKGTVSVDGTITDLNKDQLNTILGVVGAPLIGQGGFELSTNSADSEHDINISSGLSLSENGSTWILLNENITKKFDATFLEGHNNGGFAASESLPTNGTIHIWVISKADGTTDVFANNHSVSGLNPTLPSGFVNRRWIGSLRTDVNSNILGFIQFGNYFQLLQPILDLSDDDVVTSYKTVTLSVPGGRRVIAKINVRLYALNSGVNIFIQPGDFTYNTSSGWADNTASTEPSPTYGVMGSGAISGRGGVQLDCMTDNNSQLKYSAFVTDASAYIGFSTVGWTVRF